MKAKEWIKPDDDQQTILALQSVIQAVKATASKHSKQRNEDKMKTKNKDNENSRKLGTGEWAWKKKAPKPGESHSKNHSGKTYTWCLHHELWSLHEVDSCFFKPDKKKDKKK